MSEVYMKYGHTRMLSKIYENCMHKMLYGVGYVVLI